MNLITFLGTGKYSETTYILNGQKYLSSYVAAALGEFLKPEKIVVLHTEESSVKLPDLSLACAQLDAAVVPVEIPSTMNEPAMWNVFKVITDSSCGPTALDITHSFRAIPLLAAAAAVFTKFTSNVEITGVYYGAFDSRQSSPPGQSSGQETPIIDLQPFLDVMDWSAASALFTHTGDARELSAVLRQLNGDYYRQKRTAENGGNPRHLSEVSTNLASLSAVLSIARPREIPGAAKRLMDSLQRAADEISAFAPPLAELLGGISEKYSWMAWDNRDDTMQLQNEYELIKWYMQHQQIMQGVSLSREWLISFAVYLLKEPLSALAKREFVTIALNEAVKRDNDTANQAEEVRAICDQLKTVSCVTNLASAWSFVRDLRNDIDHCGMTKQDVPTDTLLANANKLPSKLAPLMERLRSVQVAPQ